MKAHAGLLIEVPRHYWGVLIQQNDITMDSQMGSDLIMSAPNPTCR